jgi:hypothetical protein
MVNEGQRRIDRRTVGVKGGRRGNIVLIDHLEYRSRSANVVTFHGYSDFICILENSKDA